MDVHKESISIAVMNSVGKAVMECVNETKASTILQFIGGSHRDLRVTFEEGTWAAWLHDLLKPHVTEVVVCNPRKWLQVSTPIPMSGHASPVQHPATANTSAPDCEPAGQQTDGKFQRRHGGPSPTFSTCVTNVIFESTRSPICAVISQQPGVEKIK